MSSFSRYNPFAWVPLAPRLGTVEWCEANVYLSPRVPTSEPGQFAARNISALCRPGGPVEALDDETVETVVVRKGSQTAMTTTAYLWLAKELARDPSSVLLVMNSEKDAKEKSDETWRPIWEDSPSLRRYMPVSRRKNWTRLFQRIHGAPVYWIGANSAGRLGSKPIRRLVLDEVDKYPAQTKSEAGAAALARQRVKSFRKKGLAKILEFSTPTDEAGEVNVEYMNGDQRHLWVRCWKCGVEQVMVWAAFKLDMSQAKTDAPAAVAGAHYECPHCKAHWTDDQRWAAIDGGEWRPTASPRDPKCRSFWLPSWCSKFVKTDYLAAQWIKAQGSKSALQDFINSECGEPYVHYDERLRDDAFATLEGDYAEGELWAAQPVYAVPDAQAYVLGGCDVQKGYLVAVFRQFRDDGESGLVWGGTCQNFEALDEMAARFDAKFVLVDQRYRTREVQEFCARNAGYIPAMGVNVRARVLFSCQSVDVDEGRRGQGGGRRIELVTFDGDMLKDILAALIQRSEGATRWMVPRGYAANADYCRQMTAERNVNGRWINPLGHANHYWDAEALALLCAIRVGVFKTSRGDESEK